MSKLDRKWLILHKTKLFRIKKLNKIDFYASMSRDVSKLKYDGEILKDLRRTFPMVEAF